MVVATAPPANGHSDKGGPPPWAPAHGYRAKHRYCYYPSPAVYFDLDSKVYFFYDGGRWQVSVRLPHGITVRADECVSLEMDTDKPYDFHTDVVKKYPPGKNKQKEKGKSKKK